MSHKPPGLGPPMAGETVYINPQTVRKRIRLSERRISNPMNSTTNLKTPSAALKSCETVADGNGLTHRLIGLPEDVTIDSWEEHDHTIECFVSWNEPKGDARICPECGSTRCVKKDKGTTHTEPHPFARGFLCYWRIPVYIHLFLLFAIK